MANHYKQTRLSKLLARMKRRRHYIAAGGVLLAAIVVAVWASYVVPPRIPAAPAPVAAPPTVAATPTVEPPVATTPPPRPETSSEVYLNELREAGVELDEQEQKLALRIADDQVSVGHLVGRREVIREQFRKRIPRLTEEEVEICKTAVEAYFLDVTGKKQ